MKCRGCNRELAELTVFHAKKCTAKQTTLEETMKA